LDVELVGVASRKKAGRCKMADPLCEEHPSLVSFVVLRRLLRVPQSERVLGMLKCGADEMMMVPMRRCIEIRAWISPF
jgi:hypothetical protein